MLAAVVYWSIWGEPQTKAAEVRQAWDLAAGWVEAVEDEPAPAVVPEPLRPERSVPRGQIVVVTAPERCLPCAALEEHVFPALESVGWRIGHSETDHIRIVHADHDRAAARWKVEAIPTLIRLADGVETGRREGFVSAVDLADWFFQPEIHKRP